MVTPATPAPPIASTPAPAPVPTSPPTVNHASDLASPPPLLQLLHQHHQHLLDRVTPYTLHRWVFLLVLVVTFFFRILYTEGFYIVCYVLFIFILNQFILFLQPKDRASLIAAATSTSSGDEAPLPMTTDDEFRPFVRRLPEFRFWHSTTVATFLSILSTFFSAFDVPVFWPILLFYFVMLFVVTMRRQWMDMRALKYVPWDIGTKKVYRSNAKKVSVTATDIDRPVAQTNDAMPRPQNPIPMLNVSAQKKPSLNNNTNTNNTTSNKPASS